jgi:DNA polymerase-3 subunit epsilon
LNATHFDATPCQNASCDEFAGGKIMERRFFLKKAGVGLAAGIGIPAAARFWPDGGEEAARRPVRQIVLDTETTGLGYRQGHRIVEIGCLELQDRRLTGRGLHRYIDPERDIDEGAQAVHGLSREFLADKPRFAEIAHELAGFIAGAELLIHNAPFDLSFLDAEFTRLGWPATQGICPAITDTLRLARARHPGQGNSLDALCERYGVDSGRRVLHGALLDAELLAKVYLAMTRG